MTRASFQRFDLIVALYIFGVVTAELMGAKTIPFFHLFGTQFNASVAVFLLPLLYSLTDVVVEVYGRARARGLVYTGSAIIVLLILYTTLVTSLPPTARFAATEPAYDTIFHASLRLSLASLAAFVTAELLDVAIFAKMRTRLRGQSLWLRTNASNILSLFVDSAVFLTLAFYSCTRPFADNVSFILSLLLPYWFLKCIMSILATPFVYAGVRWLRGEAALRGGPA